ncbi:MAG: hypothetical protein V2I45_09505 [Halieaceae bacterium]|nr:hypothetical protein [Halieaceae bacterium]
MPNSPTSQFVRRAVLRWLFVVLIASSGVLYAQQQAPAQKTAEPAIETPPPAETTTPAADTADMQPPAADARPSLDYEPTESISEDLSVSFPVDI